MIICKVKGDKNTMELPKSLSIAVWSIFKSLIFLTFANLVICQLLKD